MSDKKPTVSALQRKIERLEAQVEQLKADKQKAWDGYGNALGDLVDAQMRIKQAVRLLQGEDV
jgi:outer membrane murein-binding lipoprotein Lpp